MTAKAEGLPTETLTLETVPVKINAGLSTYLPQATLKGKLDKGATPSTPSYKDTKREYRFSPQKQDSIMKKLKIVSMTTN